MERAATQPPASQRGEAARGRWIAFEGWEGSGKSTQADVLAQRLDARLTREPGGTPLGQGIRELLLHSSVPLAERAEALLFAADRAQHLVEVVAPTLADGRHVVSDRSLYSSLAYQGGGGGLDLDELSGIMSWALDGHLPDLVVLLEVPWDEAWARLGGLDRIESRHVDYHRSVISAFEALAAADPDRWLRVPATGSIDEVAGRVHDQVARALRRWA